jgi:hypothetical protein
MAFTSDLEGFRANLERQSRPGVDIEPAIDLRRRGLEASNHWAARQAAREWVAEQEGSLDEE